MFERPTQSKPTRQHKTNLIPTSRQTTFRPSRPIPPAQWKLEPSERALSNASSIDLPARSPSQNEELSAIDPSVVDRILPAVHGQVNRLRLGAAEAGKGAQFVASHRVARGSVAIGREVLRPRCGSRPRGSEEQAASGAAAARVSASGPGSRRSSGPSGLRSGPSNASMWAHSRRAMSTARSRTGLANPDAPPARQGDATPGCASYMIATGTRSR